MSASIASPSASNRLALGLETIGFDHGADQAKREAAVCADEPAGEHQLRRNRRPHHARQEVADADVARREADADEGRVHLQAWRGDPHVAGERQGEPAAGRRAVDQGDDRLGTPAHGDDDLADLTLAHQALSRVAPGGIVPFLEVQAGAERAARAAEGDGPHVVTPVQAGEEVTKLLD
jgi:hypothetical protein